jgi:alpha-tubulin suppressor-like RCC1 family protein
VDGLENVVEIAVGARHGCARITDGSVRCWGRGAEGQLGSATSEVHSTPAPVDGVTNATSLRAGGTQTCALTRAGQVLCWGAGSALHAIAW